MADRSSSSRITLWFSPYFWKGGRDEQVPDDPVTVDHASLIFSFNKMFYELFTETSAPPFILTWVVAAKPKNKKIIIKNINKNQAQFLTESWLWKMPKIPIRIVRITCSRLPPWAHFVLSHACLMLMYSLLSLHCLSMPAALTERGGFVLGMIRDSRSASRVRFLRV